MAKDHKIAPNKMRSEKVAAAPKLPRKKRSSQDSERAVLVQKLIEKIREL